MGRCNNDIRPVHRSSLAWASSRVDASLSSATWMGKGCPGARPRLCSAAAEPDRRGLTPPAARHLSSRPQRGQVRWGDATMTSGPYIALLWRGQAAEWTHRFHEARQWPIMQALRALGATARPVLYRDEAVREIRDELLSCDARSDGRRVGKGGGSTVRSRGAPV